MIFVNISIIMAYIILSDTLISFFWSMLKFLSIIIVVLMIILYTKAHCPYFYIVWINNLNSV